MRPLLAATPIAGAWAVFIALRLASGDVQAMASSARQERPTTVQVSLAEQRQKPVSTGEPRISSAKPSAPSGAQRQGEALRVVATYREPARVIRWMLRNGWNAILIDANGQPAAGVLSDGSVFALTSRVVDGVPREAGPEVAAILPNGKFPPDVKTAWVIWSPTRWGQISARLHRYADIRSAKIEYQLTQRGLLVTIAEVRTGKGIELPGETFELDAVLASRR